MKQVTPTTIRTTKLKSLRICLAAGIPALAAVLCAFACNVLPGAMQTHSVDVCVYGATPAGITAAITAKQEGANVIIVEPSRWVGGILGAGLKIMQDCPEPRAVGGLTRSKIFTFARQTPRQKCAETPPEIRGNFAQWLAAEGIRVVYERRVVSACTANGTIASVRFEASPPDERGVPPARTNPQIADIISAKVFIDASYEGDLMKFAGVRYSVGREASSVHDEKPAGVNQPTNWTPIDPYVKPGNPASGLLPLLEAGHDKPEGAGDDYTQAYNYRFYVTSDPAKRIAFEKPASYNPAQYELVGRFIEHLKETCKGNELGRRLTWIFPGALNQGEYNYDRRSLVTNAPVGISRLYQDGDWEARSSIWRQHMDYLAGLHHFLVTDPRTPPGYREKIAALGLNKTMHEETQGWPHQLYVRITRRMAGSYVVTHKDVLNQTSPKDSIGLALYGVDTYPVRRYVARKDGRLGVATEGNMFIGGARGTKIPYQIPYRAITPKREECTNLLVPVCFSASYIAYASARMEPVFSVLGESAGVAAAISAREKKPVQDINVPALQARLRARGQILDWHHDNQ